MYIKQWLPSPLKNKKYRVILSNGKHIDFGDKRYQQYRDSSPLRLYSAMDHRDNARQAHYYLRHNIDYPEFSADWLSKRFLW